MGRFSVAAFALGLGGCAQIFGIDTTSAPPDAALPPAATLTLERLSIGASVEHNPLDTTGVSAAYYVADSGDSSGLRRIAATATGNVFSAELPDGVPASVEFVVNVDPSNTYKVLVAFPSRDIKFFEGAFEHPRPEAAPAAGMFDASLTLPTGYEAAQLIRLYAIGPWSYHDFAVTELPAAGTGATAVGPVAIAYNTTQFPSAIGARPLQKVTAADRVVALRYVGGDLTAAGDVATFDQSGATDPISSTLVEVAHTPLAISVDVAANATRLAQTTPANPSLTLSWGVSAAPAWQYANSTGIQLNAGTPAMTDTMITAGFGNPFEAYNWKSLFIWNPSRYRTYTPPALMLPVNLYNGVQQYMTLVATNTVDVQAGMPVLVSINDQPLTADGVTLTIDPNKSVKLSMVADRTANTYYQYNIAELVPNAAAPPTALDMKLVYAALGPVADVRIPAGVFVTGKTYSVRAHCVKGGFPGIQTGDFTIRDLPLTLGYFDSGVFTVAAP